MPDGRRRLPDLPLIAVAAGSPPSPLDRLADLWFYAPIGALYRLRGGPFAWADEGRRRVDQQVQVARMIGRFAVDRSRRELTRRLDAMAEQRRLAAEGPIIETTATEHEPAQVPPPPQPQVPHDALQSM